ncbi:MAG: hypothetical protein NQU48_01905 [Hadesarchaea archaeon]|nr:hypothetical protein [Hadesarchaea archaeon]TDA31076.1 MAG: hypothetical protein DSO04_04790 [Hadesarchaea archaeon]
MKALRILPCLVLCLLLLPGASAASLENLSRNPGEWDGRTVTVAGEVVGRLDKGSHVWLNLWENGWSLGVWCPKGLAEGIRVVGDYFHVGDRVEVTGVFHARCGEHGGEPDLHAENLLVISGGYEVPRPVNLLLLSLSFAVLAVALSAALLLRLRRREPFLGYAPEGP